MKIYHYHARTIEEAINNLQVFFECDMWHAKEAEWKTEEDMLKYLKIHFKVLNNEIKRINKIKGEQKIK